MCLSSLLSPAALCLSMAESWATDKVPGRAHQDNKYVLTFH